MKKAFDQTVCDLKRKVNKKVLKIPEIEQKVLDATSNEPCDPPCTLLADIAQASRNYHERQMIMKIIWKRINDTGRNWLRVHKALAVLEYMVANGSERVIDDIRECAYQIQALNGFEYIDSSGMDQGNDVRKRAQSLVVLVNDEEQIEEARQKAAANRDETQGEKVSELDIFSRPTDSLPEDPTSAPPNSATGLPPQPLPPLGVTPVNPNMHEGKSTVWAEALSRLTNWNISGPKTNPPADVGGDNDALNRKEKRMDEEKGGGPGVGVDMGIKLGKNQGGGPGVGVDMGISMGKNQGGGPGVGVDMGISMGKEKGGGPGVGVDMGIRMGKGKGGGPGVGV